jgi:hypothetical protein
MSIFLVTILSCSQVFEIVQRLQNISLLTKEQKNEIVLELRRVVPTCPILIKNN